MSSLCLTVHAGYACRHTGACCRTWTVAAEPRVVHLVSSGHVIPGSSAVPLFVRAESASEDAWNIARTRSGDCVFFNRTGTRLCAIHEAAGVDALPAACRH